MFPLFVYIAILKTFINNKLNKLINIWQLKDLETGNNILFIYYIIYFLKYIKLANYFNKSYDKLFISYHSSNKIFTTVIKTDLISLEEKLLDISKNKNINTFMIPSTIKSIIMSNHNIKPLLQNVLCLDTEILLIDILNAYNIVYYENTKMFIYYYEDFEEKCIMKNADLFIDKNINKIVDCINKE